MISLSLYTKGDGAESRAEARSKECKFKELAAEGRAASH